MNKEQTFKEFLSTHSAQVVLADFTVNLLLAAALACVLGWVYRTYGRSLSNRKLFSRNFLPITMTTMLVITIVKSSLALSLGLVGALSIVRFRAAIKEPEELTYLFLSIAVGLGLGAGQRAVTLTAFALIAFLLAAASGFGGRNDEDNLFLSVVSPHPKKLSVEDLAAALNKHCAAVGLQRYEEGKDALEASFVIELDGFGQLEKLRTELAALDKDIRLSFLDGKGLA